MSYPLLTPPPTGLEHVPFEEQVRRARHAWPSDFPTDLTQVLVALDVDGTVLRPDGASHEVQRAFADLIEAGATVVIATGRGVGGVRPVFDYVGSNRGWAVCSNGAIIARWDPDTDGGVEIVDEHRFIPAQAVDALKAAIPRAIFAVEDGEGFAVSELFSTVEVRSPQRVISMEELRHFSTPKLIGRAHDMERDEFDSIIKSLGIEEYTEFAVGWTSWVDIGPKGRTKASGLEELASRLGIPHSGTVAVGDGTNDIPMLTWAAHGVAMGGATDEVRAYANAVTGPVEHDGAAAVMRAIVDR